MRNLSRLILLVFFVESSCKDVIAQCDASFNSSSTTICSGNTVNFTNTSTGSVSYSWKINEVGFSNLVNASYIFSAAGSYDIELVVSDGGTCFDSVTTVITVNQTPSIDVNVFPTTIYQNDSVFVSFNTTDVLPGATYSWNFCDAVNQNNDAPFYYSWDNPGTNFCVCAQLTNTNGCTDNDCVNGITVLYFNDLISDEIADIALYPNPTSDQFYIELSEDFELPVLVLIYNLAGEIVCSENYQDNKIIVHRNNLDAGIYQIAVFTGESLAFFSVVFE